jgi:hypothetical protein
MELLVKGLDNNGYIIYRNEALLSPGSSQD